MHFVQNETNMPPLIPRPCLRLDAADVRRVLIFAPRCRGAPDWRDLAVGPPWLKRHRPRSVRRANVRPVRTVATAAAREPAPRTATRLPRWASRAHAVRWLQTDGVAKKSANREWRCLGNLAHSSRIGTYVTNDATRQPIALPVSWASNRVPAGGWLAFNGAP